MITATPGVAARIATNHVGNDPIYAKVAEPKLPNIATQFQKLAR
jgi:hypothetical protein